MKNLGCIILIFAYLPVYSQQVPDKQFELPYFTSKYNLEEGPMLYIDEAHHNFHTMNGGYGPFSKLLLKDGYKVAPFTEAFSKKSLEIVDILVIVNAMADTSNWELPTRSAFTSEEITTLKDWVYDGGSLFLIADHMPAAGAAAKLAIAFDFNFINGDLYNFKTYSDFDVFRKSDASLSENPLTIGIDSVTSFHGQAFVLPDSAQSVLNVGKDYIIFLPSEIGKIHGSKTPKFYAKGLSQGAYMEYGKGRLAVFGEAGMFTAQTSNSDFKMGMNNENAGQNYKLLLNIIHWLDKL